MNPNSTIPVEPRVLVELKLNCTVEQCKHLNKQIEEELQAFAEDATLTIKYVHPGSVILGFECSKTGGKNIISVFKAGQLNSVLGLDVLEVRQMEDLGEQDGEKTFFEKVWSLGHGILLLAKRWPRLSGKERFDVVLTVVVGICFLGVTSAAISGLLWLLLSTIVLGVGAMALLVWRQWPRTAVRKQRSGHSLAEPLLVLITVLVTASICWLGWRHMRFVQGGFHNQLHKAGLPPELYDRQGQFESLIIQQGALTDLEWLNSTTITHFEITSRGLNSLSGVAHAPELQYFKIDLTQVPIESLHALSTLNGLQTLVLQHVERAKTPKGKTLAVPESAFPKLKKLDLDFARSSIASLPNLISYPELQDLALNLRATTAITELPDLSGLRQLHSVALFVDNSRVRSIRSLASLDQLQMLTLALDGTQLGLLQGWLAELANRPGPRSLTLFFTTPPNANLPNLGGVRNLISLSLITPGSEPPARTPILDITHLDGLQELTISAENSEMSALPAVGQLTTLLTLNLDLEASRVATLPDISQLHDLQRLTLDLTATAIGELPDFAQLATSFARLQELNLFVARSQIRSLRGIERLHGLRRLSLNISGTTITDLKSIASITSLDKLTLRLQWSQVGALPDLAALKNLRELELVFDDWFDTETLPDLSSLSNLQKLKLGLENSHADLSSLEKVSSLVELNLDLKGSSVEVLPDLGSLKNLRKVAADIRHSRIQFNQLANFRALEELIIDNSFSSLEHLPQSVKGLTIAP